MPTLASSKDLPPLRFTGLSGLSLSWLSLGWLLLGSCASHAADQQAAIDAVRDRHAVELDAFKRQQLRLAAAEDSRGTIDFGALGELLVSNVALVGWPGSASLRADFTWVNTHQRTRRAPTVQLSIVDEAGDDWRSVAFELASTFGIEYGRGSTYSAWLYVPTDGLELQPGWTWGIELLPPD